jgi:hypothetical protein
MKESSKQSLFRRMEIQYMNGHNQAMIQVIGKSGSHNTCVVPGINVQQLSHECIALATICAMTLVIKQIRLLIESSKKK